jgi:rhodanese-related sulfurtransferase
MSMLGAGEYAGDVSANGAYELLKKDNSAMLIDVRTKPEWAFVGTPDLSGIGNEPLFLEWQEYPSMKTAPDFVRQLQAMIAEKGGDQSTPILFLCRSGARSRAAAIAMAAAGYSRCFNIAGGFEGGQDDKHRRGSLNGWKADGLPWEQS